MEALPLWCVYLIFINKGEGTRGEGKGNVFSYLRDSYLFSASWLDDKRYYEI